MKELPTHAGVEKRPDLKGIGIVIVDADPASLRGLKTLLEAYGARVRLLDSIEAARIEITGDRHFSVLLVDIRLLDAKGALLIEQYRGVAPGGLLYVTGEEESTWSSLDSARMEVDDLIRKPVNGLRFATMIEDRLGLRLSAGRALATVDPLISQSRPYFQFRSPAMRKALENLPRLALSSQPILISGETGTGKEIISRAIHVLSPRSAGPFVAVNCGAIPEGLIEGELFGHEKGAFTGAEKTRRGKFEMAHGGTLLLDEIGDMPLLLQVRLLRVLEERHIFRVGGERPVPINVRVLAATRRDLSKSVKDGLFREDLYYRLNVLRLYLPPLRERLEDISFLAVQFLGRAFSEIGAPAPHPSLSPATIDLLERLPWRGNVRELRNLMTRVATLLPAGIHQILPVHVLPHVEEEAEEWTACEVPPPPEEGIFVPFGTPLDRVEDILIARALQQTGGNRTKAAELLGISIRTLRRRLNRENQKQ